MSLIRIDVPGYEDFTGFMGTVEFKNGVSVREPAPNELARLAANIKIVNAESNEQVGPAVRMTETKHLSAPVQKKLEKATEEVKVEKKLKYTEDDLLEIASEKGIKGVREVAAEFGVKGVEINKMIAEVMRVQNGVTGGEEESKEA